MKQHVNLIITARWVYPVVPSHQLLQDHAVVVNGDTILDICPVTDALTHYQADETVHLKNHVLMPGLINLHAHAAMTLMRGLADGLALQAWLQEHIWPAEAKLVSPEFVHDGTVLACAEMLSGGVTTFNDMYFYPAAAAAASIKMGVRANLGLVVIEFPTQYATDAGDYIKKGLDARDQLKSESLISFSFAPHAPYTVADDTFQRIATLANQVNISIHTHLHETKNEINESEDQFGLRPLARLANLDLLGPTVTFAHCVHMDQVEMQLLAEQGCSIAHCPSANLKLASGIAPIAQAIKYNVNVGLGTDGAAGNNRQDIFTEMRLAALLAKAVSDDATVIPAHQAIEMATINGAKALGLDDKIGSIEKGKLADLTAVQFSDLEMQPCFDPISHLVYVAGREHVSHTWVAGELRYHQPIDSAAVYSGIEPRELTAIVAKWQSRVTEFKSLEHLR
ncbi:MAG: TRZ/ATZ family hydrolase [Methylophilaceae bacterium]|nr:TRZ/ATZ family hydrolase [Methylophilaceae bacterium]